MQVRIGAKEYEYFSDYPNGWSNLAGDAYKFPVAIGPHNCFVKRFERKTMDELSGWQLLVTLKGKSEANLPGIHDTVPDNEEGRNIYYVIFEYIEGNSLERLVKENVQVDLVKLTRGLFKALGSLNRKNYWITGFCEENIYCEKDGRFLLVDLHKTAPTSKLPTKNIIGNNQLWNLVFNFYRETGLETNLHPNNINGLSLNCLQAVFLIWKLSLCYKEKVNYDSEELFKQLPSSLNESSSKFKEIFTNVLRNDELAIQPFDIEEIKKSILEILPKEYSLSNEKEPLIIATKPSPFESKPPEILHISISNKPEEYGGIYKVAAGEPFELEWEVLNHATLELYRNGALYSNAPNTQKSIVLKEFFDGRISVTEYKLVATNEYGKSASAVLRVMIKDLVTDEPIIEDFDIIDYEEKYPEGYYIKSGENFTLGWKVKKAISIELNRNGAPYRSIPNSQEKIVLKEFSDGRSSDIVYKLIVVNDKGASASASLKVRFKNRPGIEPLVRDFTLLGYLEKKGDEYIVGNGANFKLSWTVENAATLELLRNNAPYRIFKSSQEHIELKEFADSRAANIIYTLIAVNGSKKSEARALTLRIKKPSPGEPIISDFAISNYVEINGEEYRVASGEYFTLSWNVSNADKLEICKNGSVYRELNNYDKSIDLKELNDDAEIKIEYRLQASNESAVTVSNPINILVGKIVGPGPEIVEFKSDKYLVKKMEPFILSWDTKNVNRLELHKNGKLFKVVDPDEKSVELTEAFESRLTSTEYTLVASNNFGRCVSEPVIIDLESPIIPARINWVFYLKVAAIILGAVIVFFLARWAFRNLRYPDAKIKSIEPQNLFEDSTVTIYGENFFDAKKMEVLFNASNGKIVSYANDSLVVAIPDLKNEKSPGKDITLTVKGNGHDLFSRNLQLFDKNAFAVRRIKIDNYLLDSTVTLYCNNLRNINQVSIYFNYAKGMITNSSKDSLVVKAPHYIPNKNLSDTVKINVRIGGKTVYTSSFKPE